MTPHVTIHRCQLRLCRRDGWSWGPEPRKLIEAALRLLPSLLEEHLPGLVEQWPTDEVASTVRITVPVSLNRLLSAASSGEMVWPASTMSLDEPSIATPPRIAVDKGQAASDKPSVTTVQAGWAGEAEPALGDLGLSRTLRSWQEKGILGVLLQRFEPESLSRWHDALARYSLHAARHTTVDQETRDRLKAAMRSLQRMLGPLPATSTERILHRLILVLAAARECELPPERAILWLAVDAILPDEAGVGSTARSRSADASRSEGDRQPSSETSTPAASDPTEASGSVPGLQGRAGQGASYRGHSVRSAPGVWDTEVDCALPFLLLAPLVQVGWFDALAACFEVEEIQDAWPALAAGLAYKAMPGPGRARRRDLATLHAAAVFAGSPEPVDESDITELGRRMSDAWGPAEAVIARALLEGHLADKPFLLHCRARTQERWLLDTGGLFPVTSIQSSAQLRSWLALADSQLVLVPRLAADPGTLQSLQEDGLRFLTDAPPSRQETWRVVKQGSGRWWTNDTASPQSALLRHAGRLDPATETAETLLQTLLEDRPAAALRSLPHLEASLAQAAALGLGQIAWTLGADREETDPLLTLERLSNLGARVRFREDEVKVTLPLGKRSTHLAERGLLEDVSHVPWLHGRRVTFHRG